MFTAYSPNSTSTIIPAYSAKLLLAKLILCEEQELPHLEFEIGYMKYHGYSEQNNALKDFQTFTEEQAVQLSNFLNKNNVECRTIKKELNFYSQMYEGNVPYALVTRFSFPDLKTSEELIAKLNALFPDPAAESQAKVANGPC